LGEQILLEISPDIFFISSEFNPGWSRKSPIEKKGHFLNICLELFAQERGVLILSGSVKRKTSI
jgi:hypothetical protein